MKHHCPMCGEQWNDDVCATCGWFEGKRLRYSEPRRTTRRTERRIMMIDHPQFSDERRERLAARLKKCAAQIRPEHAELWKASPASMEHRRACSNPDHYGCNNLQAVEAMEEAADLLSAAPAPQDVTALLVGRPLPVPALDPEVSREPDATPVDKRTTGLYEKFRHIERTDGTSAPGGKHDGCDYFVLDLTHDPHAPAAIRAYAESCRADYPLLAADLDRKFAAPPPSGAHRPEPSAFYDEHGGRTNRALGERVSDVMQEINDCSPGATLAQVPTLFAFGPIYDALAAALASPSSAREEPPLFSADRDATCDWNCRLSYPHDGPCSPLPPRTEAQSKPPSRAEEQQ